MPPGASPLRENGHQWPCLQRRASLGTVSSPKVRTFHRPPTYDEQPGAWGVADTALAWILMKREHFSARACQRRVRVGQNVMVWVQTVRVDHTACCTPSSRARIRGSRQNQTPHKTTTQPTSNTGNYKS
jgi:hypothetical protein